MKNYFLHLFRPQSWAELAEKASFSTGISLKNALWKKENKVRGFAMLVSLHYENKIVRHYGTIVNETEKKKFADFFGIFNCLECETVLTENALRANDDCCPSCGWEHDGDNLI